MEEEGGGKGREGGGKRCGEDSIEKRAPDEVQHFAPKRPLSTQKKNSTMLQNVRES